MLISIFYNPHIKYDLKKTLVGQWCSGTPMAMNEFEESYSIKTYFLEYGSLCIKVRNMIRYHD